MPVWDQDNMQNFAPGDAKCLQVAPIYILYIQEETESKMNGCHSLKLISVRSMRKFYVIKENITITKTIAQFVTQFTSTEILFYTILVRYFYNWAPSSFPFVWEQLMNFELQLVTFGSWNLQRNLLNTAEKRSDT